MNAYNYKNPTTSTEDKTRVKPLNSIIIQNKTKLNAPILIAGFPGPGLVGSVSSTSYIINKLHMHQIACVDQSLSSTWGNLCWRKAKTSISLVCE